MITADEIIGLISREVRGSLPDSMTLDEGTRLDDLGLSSLQVAEIIFTLEENHEAEFDSAWAADVRTIGDLIELANDATSAKKMLAPGA
jgi:acyl carrier protein